MIFNKIHFTSVQYNKQPSTDEVDNIKAVIDGKTFFVPLDPENTDYAEIMRQVKEGTLTIKDAD